MSTEDELEDYYNDSEEEELVRLDRDDSAEMLWRARFHRARSRSSCDLTDWGRETIERRRSIKYNASEIYAPTDTPHQQSSRDTCLSVTPTSFKLRRTVSEPSLLNSLLKTIFTLPQDFYEAMKEVKVQKNCVKNVCLHKDDKKFPLSDEKMDNDLQQDNKEVAIDTSPKPATEDVLVDQTTYESFQRECKKTPAEIAQDAGRKYVILPPKKKKTTYHTISKKRLEELENFLTLPPSILPRSESMYQLRNCPKKSTPIVPLNTKRPVYNSIPSLLDFDTFARKRGIKENDVEREFVRNVWNKWFDECYPSTPDITDTIHDESYTGSDTEEQYDRKFGDDDGLAGKTNSVLSIHALDTLDDIGYLLDTDENKETRQEILDEIEELTVDMEKLQQPTAFMIARRGALLRRVGHLKRAMADLNKAISTEPLLLDAYWHRHLIYLTEGWLSTALDDLSVIVTHNKHHSRAYLSRAEIFRRMGDSTMALVNYTQALRLDPDNQDAYVRRAQMYEKEGGDRNMLLALEDYSIAKKLKPDDPEPMMKQAQYYFTSKHWTAAITIFTELIALCPDQIAAYIYRGRAYVQLQNWQLALRDFSAVVHLDPSNWKAFYHRGCIYRKSQPADALRDFSVSLVINCSIDNVMSFFHRALVYCALQKYGNAVTDFEAVLKLDSNVASAQVNLGIIYLNHYNYPHRAIKKFSLGIKIDPTRMDAYALRAEGYRQLHERELALKDYTRAIHLNPSFHTYHMYRGQIVLEMGNLDLAAECVRHAAALNSNIAMGEEATQAAIVYTFLKEYDKAIDVLRRAAFHKPTPEIYMLLGQVYLKAEQFTDAIGVFKDAIDLYDPHSLWKPWPTEASQAHYMVGICHEEVRNFFEAHDEFNTAIKIDATHALAYYHRGLCRMKLRLSKGILDFNRALAINPKLFEVFLSRACYYGNKGLYCKAILNCNKALQLKPMSTRAYLYRGALKYHIRAYPLAIEDLTIASIIDSGCALAYFNRANCHQKSGNLHEAIKDYGIVLLLGKDLELKVYINRGLLYFESGDYTNALSDFEKASKISTNDRGILHTIGLCYHRLGELKMSVNVFTAIIQRWPTFVESYVSRGNVYMDYGHHAGTIQAKRDYEKALLLNPLCFEARVNLALCLQALGKFLQAWKQFTTVLTLNPRYQAALSGRAVISLQMSDTFSAYNDMSHSVKIKPTAELLTNRGVVSQFSRHLADAMDDYQAAIKLDPKYSLAYYNAANVYFHARRFREAAAYYDKAVLYNNKDEGALVNRAITKVMLGDSKEAMENFTQAVKLSPKSAHIYFNRGNLYMSLLQYDLADADYTTALSFTPNDALILTKRAEVRGKLGQRELAIEDYRLAVDISGA